MGAGGQEAACGRQHLNRVSEVGEAAQSILVRKMLCPVLGKVASCREPAGPWCGWDPGDVGGRWDSWTGGQGWSLGILMPFLAATPQGLQSSYGSECRVCATPAG